MLGGLQVRVGERTLDHFPTAHARGILGYLAYHLGESCPRPVLAEMRWPGKAEAAQKNLLRCELSRLRAALRRIGIPVDGLLLAGHDSVRLDPPAVCTDI